MQTLEGNLEIPPWIDHRTLGLLGLIKELNPEQDGLSKNQVAEVLFAQTNHFMGEIPRTYFFKNDAPETIMDKLGLVVATPLGRTNNQLPGMEKYYQPLARFLSSDGVSAAVAQQIALQFWRITSGRLGDKGGFYFEEAKIYPGAADKIWETLGWLGGPKLIKELHKLDPDLMKKLEQRSKEAEMWYDNEEEDDNWSLWKAKWGNPAIYSHRRRKTPKTTVSETTF